jgi:hypothetical protein
VNYIPYASPSSAEFQRQVASQLNALFQRFVVDYTGTPFASDYYANAQISVNGATPGAWYSALQGGEVATDALTLGVLVPSTATNHQTNVGAFYIQSDRAQPGNGGDVAGYFQAVSNADDCAVFPINTVAADGAAFTGQILGNEIDFNVNASDTVVNGLNLVLVDNTGGTLSGSRNAYRAGKAFGVDGWENFAASEDGAIDGFFALVGSQTATAGTSRSSQKIGLVSYTSGDVRYIGTLSSNPTGGIDFQLGAAGGSYGFLNAAGNAFLAYISTNGLTLPEIAAGSVLSPAAGYQTLFIDTADNKLKRKNSAGTVTIIA